MNVKQPTQQEIKAKVLKRMKVLYPGSEVIQGYIGDEQASVTYAGEHSPQPGLTYLDIELYAPYSYKATWDGFYSMLTTNDPFATGQDVKMAEFSFRITRVFKVS